MEQLERIQAAIWYDFLCGHYTYKEGCDLFELLLKPKNELLREAV